MSAVQALVGSYANPLIVVDAADFNGTTNALTVTTLTGQADGKVGLLSVWVRLDAGDGTSMFILCNGEAAGTNRFRFLRAGTLNRFEFAALNAAGTTVVSWISDTARTAGATWLHILTSWNAATGARHLYINDVSDLTSATVNDDTIDYTTSLWRVGVNTDDSNFRLNACLAELYFNPSVYMDLTLVSNRRKFISASGDPVHLGTTGALPTGTAPIVYQHLGDGEAVANFGTNRGTGGNFSVAGTLATASTSPSD